MTSENFDLDAIRTRWIAQRELINLTDPGEPSFALGGLASLSHDPDVRVAILPADPQADLVDFDQTVVEWLQTTRSGEYRDVTDYGQVQTTSYAIVLRDRTEQPPWQWFVALHRHGGIEAAHSLLAQVNEEQKFFFLRQIVSLAWLCLDLQREANQRWAIQGPLELTMGLRNTKNAFLTDFAEGWEGPFRIYGRSMGCAEPNVLLRWEVEPEFDARALAVDVGARIENAFDSVNRRHIASRGEYEGRFDPRYGGG